MKEFNFERTKPSEKSLSDVAKDIETKIFFALENDFEKSRDEYAAVAAKVLFEDFGGERFKLAAEYFVAEGVVIGMAARAIKDGLMGQITEGSLRMNLRMRISDLEIEDQE